jgi:hypothetical protein
MLLDYDPLVGCGPYPQLVLLCSSENYYDPGGDLEVPGWLSNRGDRRRSAAAGWETIVGKPVKCIDIPGHHFQAFHNLYVRVCSTFLAGGVEITTDFIHRLCDNRSLYLFGRHGRSLRHSLAHLIDMLVFWYT